MVVAARPRTGISDEHAVGARDPGVDRAGLGKAADEKTGVGQQHERQRHLRAHEAAPGLAGAGRRSRVLLKRAG